MRYFHGEVKTEQVYDSDARAEELARQAGKELTELGGSIDVGRMFGDGHAILIVKLPDDAHVTPQEVVGGGVDFREVHAATVQAVEDQGVSE